MGYFLVGESPNPATIGRPDLWLLPDKSGLNHTANRLLRISGWSEDDYLKTFTVRTNVWELPNRLWKSAGRRRARALRYAADLCGADGIVVLGRRAAQAFGLLDWMAWSNGVAAVPHPSGRCRFWNDAENLTRAREFFATILRRADAECRVVA